MKRADREVKDYGQILDIISRCDSLHLALNDGGYPYVIPMNFGYEDSDGKLIFYFHGAREGKKLVLMDADPRAAFSMSCKHELKIAKVACASAFLYESACGRGKLSKLTGEEAIHGLEAIMRHYDPENEHHFEAKHTAAVSIFKLEVEELSGKRRERK